MVGKARKISSRGERNDFQQGLPDPRLGLGRRLGLAPSWRLWWRLWMPSPPLGRLVVTSST
jgi:hypothetical protein